MLGEPSNSDPSPAAPIADAFVHMHSAFTSMARLAQVGLLPRERLFYQRVCPRIGKQVIIVTSGDAADAPHVASLAPASWSGSFASIANTDQREIALFQATIPERVLKAFQSAGAKSAVIYQDQHEGGEVAIQTARLFRANGIRAGVIARAGYHWSWTVARDTAPDHPKAIAAAMFEGDFCRAADVVVATTRCIADMLAWQHRLPVSKVVIVPNWVQPPTDVPTFDSREPGSVLYAGRLESEKRVDLLIRAMALVIKQYPQARLNIVGDGSLAASLKALAQQVGVAATFRPRLEHSELLHEMGRCNIYAQLSRFEGHPKTIIEAMSMGAPCVVTRATGVDDEIIPNVTGIPCGDRVENVAAAIIDLLQDPAKAAKIGSAAATDIRARLSLDTVFPKLESGCERAMQITGFGAPAAVPPVRWEQTLLNTGPDGAAIAFSTSIAAYAKRLTPPARRTFLDALTARTGSLAEQQTPTTQAIPGLQDAPASPR